MVQRMDTEFQAQRPEIHSVLEDATLRYAQVWEDYELLYRGLDLKPNDYVVSIGSAGDNGLALLASGVESVAAVDLNPAQTALCELKKLAIARLEHPDFRDLCGAGDLGNGVRVYNLLKSELSAESRAFWNNNEAILNKGIIHSGRLESFWNAMRKEVFEPYIGQATLERFVTCDTLAEQRELYQAGFTSSGFEEAFRKFTDKSNVAKSGRDIAQYKYVHREDIGGFFLERFRHVCTEVPIANNFYLSYLFFGKYPSLDTGPLYLRPQVYEYLTKRIERFEIVEESLDSYVAKGEKPYSKMNLSDLFEYLSPEDTDRFISVLAENMSSGGRIAFWNHLNDRGPGSTSELKTRELKALGRDLFNSDRTFFYSDFRVLEVL